MRLNDNKKDDINVKYSMVQTKQFLEIRLESAFNTNIYYNNMVVCEVSELGKMIESLQVLKGIIENETGVIL